MEFLNNRLFTSGENKVACAVLIILIIVLKFNKKGRVDYFKPRLSVFQHSENGGKLKMQAV
jgi:hypothetical protein